MTQPSKRYTYRGQITYQEGNWTESDAIRLWAERMIDQKNLADEIASAFAMADVDPPQWVPVEITITRLD